MATFIPDLTPVTITYCSSTSTGPATMPNSTIYMSNSGVTLKSDNSNEEVNKLEQHIDELEEDIYYFNKELEGQKQINSQLQSNIDVLKVLNDDLAAQVTKLSEQVTNLQAMMVYIEGKVVDLEEKNDK